MEKIPVWINAILNEDGHMLSSGSVRTLKMIRDEHSKALSDANKEIEKYKEFITEVSVSDPDGNPLRLINKARKILNNPHPRKRM